ncbi:head maturation protease, ClpP-related [Peribacillus frigoritolerans]|uniref:head maturation protease, ClpP-related n=1 Tax=Peribacillus frigoritolerans TaxID=450367 RepID=UPI0023DC5658|nr:head maturation protease, ClpP-related [Peribacillus frigoritolerans]MDF1997590.1 Clp protease ClpP [Peribacillus frigoritolerans]
MKFLKFKNEKYEEQLKRIPHNFAAAHDEEKNESTLTIYGIIGDSWWDDSTSAADVDMALKEAGSNDLVVHLNSPGGDAFDGIAIYNRFKNHEGKVKIYVDGWACSAASVIALAADELIMGAGSMMMIHEASNIMWGTKNDFRKQAELLEKLEDGIIDIYMMKANVEREEIQAMVDNETWFSANEAVEIGFATSTATSSTMEDNEEITQLKTQMQVLQNELNQLKNTEPKNPSTVKQNRAVRIF